MLKKITFITLVAVALTATADVRSYPDRLIDSTLVSNKVIFVDGSLSPEQKRHYEDSVRRVISAFYYDQFHHFSDPGAPYFLFMSKDNALAMGMGGCVRMRAWYDWGGAMPIPAFAPYMISMNPSPTDMRHYGTTPAGSCLYFRVIGRNKLLGNYQLYIEANFNGYQARDFHLEKAYAIINDWTIGYAPSTFSDPAAVPPTVDSNGPNNKITPTNVLIRYMPVVKNHWYFAVSAETPSTIPGVDGIHTKKVQDWMPDFAAFAEYEWAQGQHVRLAAITRTLSYRNLIAQKNHNIQGWGLQLSAVGHILPQLTGYATVNYGKGHSSLGGDLIMDALDLLPNPEAPGKMVAPKSYGWNIGLRYSILPNLFTVATVSENRLLPGIDVSPDRYKYGIFSAINLFWNMTPRMQAGAEFDFGKRENFSGQHHYAKRFGLMCMFTF